MDRIDSSELQVLEEKISEGDYISFLGDLDRTGTGGTERTVILEGFRLFRYYIVKDQLSKPPNSVVIGGEGWVKIFNSKLSDCGSDKDKDVVISSLLTFLTLSTLPGNYKKSLVRKGGVDCTMKMLDEFKGDREISSLACSLFISLGLTEKDGLNAKFGKIALLVKRLVTLVANDEYGRDFALRALFHFAFQRKKAQETGKSLSHDVKAYLATEKNIRALVGVLVEPNVREIAVESALSLLWRMSTPKEDVDEDDLFPMSADVVQAIIVAMDSFESVSIREAGCGILANMSMRKSFPQETTEAALLSIHGFLKNAATVDMGLATCALHSICNMLENSASRRISLLVYRQIIETVLGLMKHFPHCEELIEFATLAIAHAARDHQAVKDEVVSLGGFDLVKVAFEEFVSRRGESPSLEVKDGSLCAIAALTGCRTGAEAVMNSGLLDLLLALLAVETDRDFAVILEIIIKNTKNGAAHGFQTGSEEDVLRQQPHLFSQLALEASSESDVVSLFQSLEGSGRSGIEIAIGGEDGFFSMLSAMSRYSDSEVVQESGCSILAELYYYLPVPSTETFDGPWSPRYQREALRIVDLSMESHRNQASIQSNGSLVVLNIMAGLDGSGVDRSAAMSMMERCLKALLECLRLHGSDRKVLKCGVAALGGSLCIADQHVVRQWDARIVKQLHEALQLTSDPESQILVLDALIVLSGLSKGFDTIANSSDVVALLDLMRSTSSDVLCRSSAVLASLVEKDFTANNHIMEYPDAIQRLLSCMSTNRDDMQIQINVCSILESLINFADDVAIPQIQQHNGIYTLCTAISTHPLSGVLIIHSCNVLAKVIQSTDLGTLSSLRELVKQSMVDMLDKHIENPDVETAIFDALWACCQQDDFFKRLMLDETRIRMVLHAMQLHVGSANLQRSGCSLIWLLSSFGNGKEVVGRCGGIPIVVNALFGHHESTVVQKEGLTALKNLAIASSNKPMLTEAGSDNAVICSLWINYKDPQVISIGLSALNNIAVDSQTRSVAQMNEQTLLLVIAAMSNFPLDEHVQKNACFYLKSCSYLAANLKLMREREDQLLLLLVRASETFPQQCSDRASSVISKMQ